MSLRLEKILFYTFLLVSFGTVVLIDFRANATFDSGDGLQHYLMARYSWKHPKLLLDLWGKPVFTLLSSPFAQFGLRGMYVFQALCAMAVTISCYKIAKKLNLNYAWTAPAFIFFSPIYFAIINTGLTEILFGTLFMLCVWLIFEKKFILSAIIFSFVPFVRAEGYFVLPLIILVFLLRRRFIAIFCLGFAFLLYTVIGYFHYHDILWVITNNYKVEENYIGMKGSFFHFIKNYKNIWGKVYSYFILLGIAAILYAAGRAIFKKAKDDFIFEEVFLILGSFLCCLLLHSLLFSMQGILNNLGMMRYMAVLIPSSALLTLRGLNLISLLPIKRFSFIKYIGVFYVLFLVIKVPFKQWFYPFHLNNEQIVMNEAGNWIKSSSFKNKRVCYLHPHLSIAAELDPFDDNKTTLFWSLDKEHLNTLADSALIVWDSHFAPQEGGLPLSVLTKDSNLIPLKQYKYYDEKYPFEVWIFMKSNLMKKSDTAITPQIISDSGSFSDISKTDSTSYNLNTIVIEDKSFLSNEKKFAGQPSYSYIPDKEYGPVFLKKLNELKHLNKLNMIEVSFNLLPCDSIKDIIPVMDIKDDGKTKAWYGKSITQPLKYNEWNSCKIQQAISPGEVNEKCILNFYFWNKGKRKFYINDIRIFYYE